jgi:hypothetical protein
MAQIDTLKYFKDLKAGGVSDEQAEAEIRALQSALDGLATKEDLKNEISALESRLNLKIDSIKTIGWALFAVWIALAAPILKLAFYNS